MFVHYAPVLPAEDWTSIDRYREDYEHFMPRFHPEVSIKSVLPDARDHIPKWEKRFVRDVKYPYRLRSQKGESNGLLHVFDHSYAHLIPHWSKTIIHCRDLNHIIQPSLKGMALLRWKQKLKNLRKATKIIAISNQLSNEIQEHLNISEEQIEVIYHGVDLECYSPHRKKEAELKLTELAELAKNNFLVLNIGTNLPRKNLETVYSAIRKLKDQGVPVKLIRVGSNGHRSGELERIMNAGIEGDVIQLGLLSSNDVALVCNICHVLSFASLYEGFGRPLLEAQACGLPLVAANNSCIPEISADGAMYHEPSSSEHLSNQLKAVYSGSKEVIETTQKGLINVKRFSWEAHLEKVVNLYQKIL